MAQLRAVRPDDLQAYLRMRTDPRMMAELGGPQDPAEMAAKVARDVAASAADTAWTSMIVPDGADPSVVAGTVTLWSHHEDDDGGDDGGSPAKTISEIGWMVLPEFQGRGLATTAVRAVLVRAARDGRWGTVHAFPSITNEPSNRLCRRSGFRLLGERDTTFARQVFRTNHWVVDPPGV